ncbi:MAG TPA: type II toxin-antitoxin system prevent-host-death family antitoxin [Chloroflexota bacterium]|nr:type II toxin-antitoxin system prevent-host-death family antitoxin [Chloroflexota bacterium]
MHRAQASSIVGVRELRQNLSVYLRRVEAGETLRVTDRGRPVALLGPLPGGAQRPALAADRRRFGDPCRA